jgi:hypothetical protein
MLDPGRAELAFALIDEYQGQGIGTASVPLPEGRDSRN